MDNKSFATQKEIIFVMYEDIIKTTKFCILKKLLTDEFKNNYKNYINYSKIEGLTDEQLMGVIFGASDINILKYLSTDLFDYDVTYIDLYLNYKDILKESKLLSFGESILILLQQNFTSKIYIYTENYDENVYKDIYDTYKSENIVYTHGEFDEVVTEINKSNKITSFVLNDITLINNLIKSNNIEYTNVLVCNTGWNYTLDNNKRLVLKVNDIDTLSKENIFKLGLFEPDPSSSYIIK